MSFFDEFKSIVPYSVKVNVGKNKQFKTDANKKSDTNYKGKMVAVYKKAKTLEEIEKYGLGEHIEYVLAEQVSMPIDIQVISEEKLTPVFEKTSKYTNKERTRHEIRIFNSDKTQVGYVQFSLTPSGDIDKKTSFYESSDRTEEIMHTTYNRMRDGKIIKDDNFKFQRNSQAGTKKVNISQREGKVVGGSVEETDLETEDEKTPKLIKYISSCVVDEIERSKRGGLLIPWECMTVEDDLFEYQKAMEDFQEHVKWFKEKTGIEVSLERVIEIDKLSYDEQEKQGISPVQFNSWHYARLARYLLDESNNLLKDFKGDYIGNILKLTDNGYEACIVTKRQKSGQDYRLYTLIDLTGTSITRGTGTEEFEDIDRDSKYFERLESADKTPTFVTRIDKEGKEELVLHRGNAVPGECPEYEQFVEEFISPFEEIQPIQIGKILNRENQEAR